MLRHTLLMLLGLVSQAAFGHEGHGFTTGMVHWIIEPTHGVTILLATVTIVGGVAVSRYRQAYRQH